MDDLPAAVAARNSAAPDLIPFTDDDLRHEIESAPPRARSHELVAEIDGTVVGFCLLCARWWTDDPSRFSASLIVHADHRRRGGGSALYTAVEADARAEGATLLYGWVRENEPWSLRFAEERGCTRTGTVDRPSWLHVPTARTTDDDERRLADEGIDISSLAELGAGEKLLRAVHRLDETTATDVPSSDTWEGSSFEEWSAYILQAPGSGLDSIWIALHGDTPIGLTTMTRHGRDAGTGYTGVDRAYRGRGIARALKMHATQAAADAGIQRLYTSNSVHNTAMLTINTALGFQSLPARVEVVKAL
jgi:GNAT superfamily N-acetyltransferase